MELIRKIVLLSLLLSSFMIAHAGGNLKTTSMKGKVTDRAGNAIAGAKVTLLNSDKEVYTDFDGNFEFNEVPQQEEQKIKVKYISYLETTTSFLPSEEKSSSLEIHLKSK